MKQAGTATFAVIPMRASCNGLLFGVLVQLISQLALCGYLIWLAASEHAEGSAAEKVDQIIFIDFLGFFLLSLIFSGVTESVRWVLPFQFEMALRVFGYIALIFVFVWFLEGAAGWPIAMAWGCGILTHLSNVQRIRTEAIVRVIWAIVSGFIAALVSSILGVKEDTPLTEHLPTLLGWGLLYFGGVGMGSFLYGLAAPLKNKQKPENTG